MPTAEFFHLHPQFPLVVCHPQRLQALTLSVPLLPGEELCSVLPDVSPTTVEAVLGSMVKNGIVFHLQVASTLPYNP
jgi:hypothetical protein